MTHWTCYDPVFNYRHQRIFFLLPAVSDYFAFHKYGQLSPIPQNILEERKEEKQEQGGERSVEVNIVEEKEKEKLCGE